MLATLHLVVHLQMTASQLPPPLSLRWRGPGPLRATARDCSAGGAQSSSRPPPPRPPPPAAAVAARSAAPQQAFQRVTAIAAAAAMAAAVHEVLQRQRQRRLRGSSGDPVTVAGGSGGHGSGGGGLVDAFASEFVTASLQVQRMQALVRNPIGGRAAWLGRGEGGSRGSYGASGGGGGSESGVSGLLGWRLRCWAAGQSAHRSTQRHRCQRRGWTAGDGRQGRDLSGGGRWRRRLQREGRTRQSCWRQWRGGQRRSLRQARALLSVQETAAAAVSYPCR